ncbi:hypothetical protein N7523_000680 [Penicillium sp. IBT 18751x]|nr:hypothetical protein N7523_000680 [Penicillium sp. IBT 18751x]
MGTTTYALDTPLTRSPVIAVTVLGAIATITTILRFVALHSRRVSLGAPEYLIVGALITIVYVDIAIVFILTIVGGAGRKVTEIDPSSVIITLKTILPLEALYGIVLGLIKSSIMLFYLRIFGTKKSSRISILVTMTIVWMWAVSVILETFLLCRPLAYNWDTSIAGTCGNRNATYVVAGTLNLVTDLMVMALPIPHIWKLQLSLSKKIALCGVFSVGLLVSIISIIRLKSLMDIDFSDITYSVQMGVMWTTIEPELAIICANMPFLKTILSRMVPGLFSTGRAKQSASGQQTFERLEEQQSNNIYPMNRIGHPAVRTNISSANTTESQRGLFDKDDDIPVFPKGSHEDLQSEGKHGLRTSASDGINVTKNFVIQYRSSK